MAVTLAPSIAAQLEKASGGKLIVRAVPGRGRCVLACTDIAAGTSIVCEHALAWLPAEAIADSAGAADILHVDHSRSQHLDGCLLQMAPFCLTPASFTPITASRSQLLSAVMQHTGFGVKRTDAAHGTYSSIMPALSLFNHDCAPNAVWLAVRRGPEDVTLRVFAQRRISVGEEVCISYVRTNTTREARRQLLEAQYGFLCSCARCASGTEDTVALMCSTCGGAVHDAGEASACAECGKVCPVTSQLRADRERDLGVLARVTSAVELIAALAQTRIHATDAMLLECTATAVKRVAVDALTASQALDAANYLLRMLAAQPRLELPLQYEILLLVHACAGQASSDGDSSDTAVACAAEVEPRIATLAKLWRDDDVT